MLFLAYMWVKCMANLGYVIWCDLIAGELSNMHLSNQHFGCMPNPNVPSQANVRECWQIAPTLECQGRAYLLLREPPCLEV